MTLASLGGGFKFVFSTRVILGIITLDLFAVLLEARTALLPVYAKDILHGRTERAWTVAGGFAGRIADFRAGAGASSALEKAGRALLWSWPFLVWQTVGFGISKILPLSLLCF